MAMLNSTKMPSSTYSCGCFATVDGRKPYITEETYPSLAGLMAGSLIRKNPSTPAIRTSAPITQNISVQYAGMDCERLAGTSIIPPNTKRIAISGIMALSPSAAPRLLSSVLSVSQALNAASLAVEPKKVMIQSTATVSETPTVAAETVMGMTAEIQSTRKAAKAKMEMPHRI